MAELVQLCALAGHHDRVWHVSWRSDGQLLASCSGDRTIRIWAPAAASGGAWECVAVLEDAQNRTIRACEWCVGELWVAVWCHCAAVLKRRDHTV